MVSVKVVERVPMEELTVPLAVSVCWPRPRPVSGAQYLPGRSSEAARFDRGGGRIRPCAARRCKPGVEDAAFDYWQVRDRLAPIQLVGTIGEVNTSQHRLHLICVGPPPVGGGPAGASPGGMLGPSLSGFPDIGMRTDFPSGTLNVRSTPGGAPVMKYIGLKP